MQVDPDEKRFPGSFGKCLILDDRVQLEEFVCHREAYRFLANFKRGVSL